MATDPPPSPVKDVFVLMLENRSFDHMLGFSGITGTDAETGTATQVNGLTGEEVNSRHGVLFKISHPADYVMPIDPAHEFADVLEQLCGPDATYPAGGPYPTMDGNGYVKNYVAHGGGAGLGGRTAFAPPVLERSLPPERMEWLQRLLEIHRRLPEAQRMGPSPSEIASYVKTSLLKQMEPWPNRDDATNRFRGDVRDELARQAGPFEMKVPCGHYRVIPELPREDALDVELVVQARMRPADPLLSGATATFMVDLIDGDEAPVADRDGDDANRHHAFLSAWVEVWGMGVVDQRGDTDRGTIVQAVNVGEAVLNHRQFTLRLIHAAGKDEVWIDQRRLVYVPAMRNPRKIGFRLYATGITVETRVGFSKLDPKQVMGN